MSKKGKSSNQSNNDRSNSLNSNNKAHKASLDNRSVQKNTEQIQSNEKKN